MEMKLYLMHLSWNGLLNLEVHKDLEDDTRHKQPSTAENSETFTKVHKLGGQRLLNAPKIDAGSTAH